MAAECVVIFDGDDTLWCTEPLYDAARRRVARYVAKVGIDADLWESLARQIDLERVERFGYAWHRFPVSSALAVKAALKASGRRAHARHQVGAAVRASSVFAARPELMPGAHDTLRKLSADSRLILLTKGQRWVQWLRIAQSGLRRHFQAVVVAPEKDRKVFESLRRATGGSPLVVSVGNSLRSDIQPALDAGLAAIWIDQAVWEHEHTDVPVGPRDVSRLIRAATLSDVPWGIETLKFTYAGEDRHEDS